MIAAVAIGSDEFKDASREFSLGVQIVSRPPDHLRPPVYDEAYASHRGLAVA